MRTIGRLGASILALAALAGGWAISARQASGVELQPGVTVFSEDTAQQQLARWAVARFERAGLDPPRVEIAFHADASGCGGHLGYAEDGHVDVCTVLVNEMARRNLLHEMGHIWIDQNVSRADRDRFLEFRGLLTWNASTADWDDRGYEQGAEIMAWAIGDGILTPQIPHADPSALEEGFQILTGLALPCLAKRSVVNARRDDSRSVRRPDRDPGGGTGGTPDRAALESLGRVRAGSGRRCRMHTRRRPRRARRRVVSRPG
jgi:hypothetical protein